MEDPSTATPSDLDNINPGNVTTGSPVDGAACFVNFDLTTDVSAITAANYLETFKASGSKWKNLGELSENGYTESTSTTSNKFKGWHGTPLLNKVSDEEDTFKTEFVEVDRDTVAQLRYGEANVTTDEDGSIKSITPTRVPTRSVIMAFAELLDNGRLRLTIFPRASIGSIDDVAHQQGSLLIYGMTFSASNDAKGHPYYITYAKPGA
ncbi:MAG: hypothetical protein MR415_02940 [Coriobacteriaceae bacterium]|uniref:phage tail tube protein n=1 Tax=Tractidigestivibacter sp. TaxID=2847320 RepID=UPI002A81AB42|nr:hypothetical protein [Tractidigestivibacter sp.]MCI6547586.1 hypothetical protein [Coriobacteriaceae bacterium]MCI7438319.1 hypothetical protein [Coriobacteriaceae bacterium]MDD7584260.1 hypothetical protein [Coriobacteriaceae bacterium]MDY4534528.1 hypothetical protein [Tractidigestivibacter sp.]